MTQLPNEQVSAFFDNEMDSAESELVMRRLTRDQELRGNIGRYALIGEAIRRNSPLSHNLPERVSNALQHEPDLTAVPATPGIGRFLRPLAGAAMAATVAAVAIVGLRSGEFSPTPAASQDAAPQVASTVPSAPPGIGFRPVSVSADSYTVPTTMPAGRQSVEARRLLNTYLVNHSQYARRMGPQGIATFRAVGYRTDDTSVPATTNQPRADQQDKR